jgi:hypothetical protein
VGESTREGITAAVHIYTHLVLAGELESYLQPDDPAAYYLGSIIPDVRYLDGIPRQQTHLSPKQILAYQQRYPHLKSFLAGFLVHCEIDLLDLTRVLFERTSLRWLGKRRQLQLAGVLIESYFLEEARFNPPIALENNEVLIDLGIEAESMHQFAAGVQQFLLNPSFQTELAALQDAQILANRRVRAYFRLIQAFERSCRLRRILFTGVPVAGIAHRLPAILLASPEIQQMRG